MGRLERYTDMNGDPRQEGRHSRTSQSGITYLTEGDPRQRHSGMTAGKDGDPRQLHSGMTKCIFLNYVGHDFQFEHKKEIYYYIYTSRANI